ncbi:helix-turn-helix transcriptional regulator [Paracoccus aurantiacus]|nr:helix-turn-helix transcriptional regulator [Paracoccus aurantiacus]
MEDTGTRTDTLHSDESRRRELADFLRRTRERLRPEKPSSKRRTPGLRREEVSDAAGISVTWYTWLEQARDIAVSTETLNRLVEALRLDRTETRYLYGLAGRTGELPAESTVPPSESLCELVTGLMPHPAYAMDRVFNVVASNPSSDALFGRFDTDQPAKSNILTRLFLDPDWKSLFVDWSAVARSAVAQFRASTSAFAQEKDATEIVSLLLEEVPGFKYIWAAAELAESPNWTKTIRCGHGVCRYDYALLRPEGGDRDYTIAIYRLNRSASVPVCNSNRWLSASWK